MDTALIRPPAQRQREYERRSRRWRAFGERSARMSLTAHADALLAAMADPDQHERAYALHLSLRQRSPRVAAAVARVGDATAPETPGRLAMVAHAITRAERRHG